HSLHQSAYRTFITFANPTATDYSSPAATMLRTDTSTLFPYTTLFRSTTTISYSATDAAGNVATHSFTVMVQPDGQPPVLADLPTDRKNIPMNSGHWGAAITFFYPTANDNCDPAVSVVRTDTTGLDSGD